MPPTRGRLVPLTRLLLQEPLNNSPGSRGDAVYSVGAGPETTLRKPYRDAGTRCAGSPSRRASAHPLRAFSTFPAMSIPTGGLAALLVVATLALSSCGSDGATVTKTTIVSPGSAEATATQTVAAETTPAKTTTQKTQTTAPKPATTTQKTQTTASAPKPAATTKAASTCPSVDVGARDGDVAETYARITSISKTDCPTATFVLQQWGGQRIGVDKALLPIGWSCSGNTCRKGSSRVSFVLEFPSN